MNTQAWTPCTGVQACVTFFSKSKPLSENTSGILGSLAYSQSMITFPLYLDSTHHATDTIAWAKPLLGETLTGWLQMEV